MLPLTSCFMKRNLSCINEDSELIRETVHISIIITVANYTNVKDAARRM